MTSVTIARPVSCRAAAKQLQPLFLHPLEAIGTGPRLERSAAQGRCAGGFHGAGGRENLLFAFDRTGSGDDADGSRADFQAAGDDLRRLFLHLAAGDFVRRQNRHDILDARAAGERFFRAVPFFADGGDHGPLGALNDVGFQAERSRPVRPCV